MNPLPALRPRLRDGLPFVYLNVATTADGKLAPTNRHFIPFSTKHDQQLLMELRTRCDAVMAGARTADAVPVNLGPGGPRWRQKRLDNGLSEYNLRVVVSGSASLDPDAEIFEHTFSPVVVLVNEKAAKARVDRLRKRGAIIHVSPGKAGIDFTAALKWLRKEWHVKRLLCEGGGEINAALFAEDLVDEIYATLCPTIFGGRNAPTLADGIGVEKLEDATRLKLKSMERIGDELYTIYRVVHKQ